MSSLRHLVLLLALVCSQGWAQVGKETDYWAWSQDSDRHRAVVRIAVTGGSEFGVFGAVSPIWFGSGCVVGKNQILTAAHVVDTGVKFEITFADGRTAEATLKAVDKDGDAACLLCVIPDGIPFVPVAVADPAEGSNVEACGFGGRGELRHFSSKLGVTSGKISVFTCFVIPGDSGGPVFSDSGQVVGVISGGICWSSSKRCLASNGGDVRLTWPCRSPAVGPIRKVLE